MSRLTLQESRRLKFAVPALLDAALTFDREHNGWLWRASGHSLVVDAGGGGGVTILARKSGAEACESVTRSPAWVAAALLHYCFKRRIPVPRNATKTIEVLPEGVALRIEMTMAMPALELSRDALGVAPPAPAPAAAGATPVAVADAPTAPVTP